MKESEGGSGHERKKEVKKKKRMEWERDGGGKGSFECSPTWHPEMGLHS